MARILAVGIGALDIINEVEGYPPEDAEVRAVGQRITCGGNATNTLTVLSLLGHQSCLAAVLANDFAGEQLRQGLVRHHIDLGACRIERQGRTPTSYICLNRLNGSRTIVHYRKLSEYRFSDFVGLDLSAYDWLHFEGRNVQDTRNMIDRARKEYPELPVSVEIEKSRPGIEVLFKGVDLLLIGQDYARSKGFTDPQHFLLAMADRVGDCNMVCAWGAGGARVQGRHGEMYLCPAYIPAEIVDTLGAGDTFNAGFIDARLQGRGLKAALEAANYLAGRKCAMVGYEGLALS
ncbi:MAG: ketohexokinase [Gammaproteobacteria bacterium]|nr:ketohexokinase [Gammaproteobacteria bacterium]